MWCNPGGRGSRQPRAKGLHLCGNGVLCGGRRPQYEVTLRAWRLAFCAAAQSPSSKKIRLRRATRIRVAGTPAGLTPRADRLEYIHTFIYLPWAFAIPKNLRNIQKKMDLVIRTVTILDSGNRTPMGGHFEVWL